MKVLPSSSSSTAFSASSAGENASASKNTAPGCIAGMFRRLLCSNSLPTHPSDHAIERAKPEEEAKVEPLASTGVVARLMGLESMPRNDFSSKSIARSQSMRELNSPKEERPLRACSFREIPTYLELEDENFFILSFEYGRKSAELGTKCKNSEMGSDQKIEEDQDRAFEIVKKKGDFKKERFKKKKKKKEIKDCGLDTKKVKADCDSENSSPTSVLDFVEFAAVPCSEKYSKVASSKSRRTLSEELENYRGLKVVSGDSQPQRSKEVCSQTRKNFCKDENYVKLWGEICSLADIDTVQNNWMNKEDWKQGVCQEICGDFELEILDELVGEMVDGSTFVCNPT